MPSKDAIILGGSTTAIAGSAAGTAIFLSSDNDETIVDNSKTSKRKVKIITDLSTRNINKRTFKKGTGDFYELTIDKHKDYGSGGICSNEYLKGLDLTNKETNESYKSNFEGLKKENAKGCLYVTWKKTTGNDNKWKGVLKIEWLLKSNDQAILLHGSFSNKADNNNKYARWTFNNLKKEGSSWKVKHFQEGISDNYYYYFPRSFKRDEYVNEDLKFVNNDERSWGFSPWINMMCHNDNSTCNFQIGAADKTTKQKDLIWTWHHNNEVKTNPITEWSMDFKDWWKVFFKTEINVDFLDDWFGLWNQGFIKQ